ncbi:MAG: phenylacetate--CoA ligase family protein, partial [Candidatus Zixiibacteriota bacterium]
SLDQFALDYQRFKPDGILAYANSLALVVDFMKAKNIELPPPSSIITSAEVLTPENREKIESYFGQKIFDRYGARETSVIASECSAHDGLHIGAEYLHLEFVQENRAVQPGENGDILITILGNYAFPFIRYKIGDVGALMTESTCRCGVTLPKMQMVAGRTTDFLLAPDGRKVSGAALTIYLAAQVPGVRQAQIIQKEHGRLTFNLVTDSRFNDSSRRMIEEKVRHFFGAMMAVEYKFVDGIARESSGKYRFSICELNVAER